MSDRGVTNQTEADCNQVDTSAHPFFTFVYSLVFLVGFILNCFVLKFYFCQAQRRSSSSIMVYLKNLAAADFLLCLCLPIRIAKYASNSDTIRLVYCNFGGWALYLNMYASILFMGYIAADRYLKIVQGASGTHILQTVQAAHIISTVTWGFLLALMSAYIILLIYTQKHLTSVPMSCEALQSGRFSLFFKIIHSCSTAIFLFVLVSLVFFYYSTLRRVSLAQQRQPGSSTSKNLAKSRRNMLVLVSVFCFCFVPYHLVRLPSAFLWSHCSWGKVFYYLLEITIMVSVLNVCLDPLMYFISCKAFRTQLNWRALSRNR